MDLSSTLLLGIANAFYIDNLIYCFIGVTLGTAVGILPGIGALTALSLLLPLSYHLDPMGAIIMMAGVYYGCNFGGSIASILLNLPGTPAHAVTCIDGYKMTMQDRSGSALIFATTSSFMGGIVGVMILIFFSPMVADMAFVFGPTEFFSLMLLGLVAASAMNTSGLMRNLAMVGIGILLGLVGIDLHSGTPRFVFGRPELLDGIHLAILAMGLFGIAEIIDKLASKQQIIVKSITGQIWPRISEWKQGISAAARGSAVGSFFGVLPGTGPAIASFMAHAVEKKLDPDQVGHGSIKGVASPEAANNAAAQTAFVPTLTLGIPGDAMTAMLLGVLILHGAQPGPLFMVENPDIFWGLVMSFLIGNTMLLILNMPLIKIWIWMLRIPYSILYPTMLITTAIGVYSINYNVFDILLLVISGIIGFFLKKLDFNPTPLLLGFILGPLMEEYLRRSLAISHGDFGIFMDRPISMSLLIIACLMICWPLILKFTKNTKLLAK